MTRIVIGIVIGVLMSGSVSAARMFEPMTQGPRVVAGVVAADGTIVSGTGFTVNLVSYGSYEITFGPGVLPGCAAMTVTQTGSGPHVDATIATVKQPFCRSRFIVKLRFPGGEGTAERPFQFIAAQAL